MAGSGVSPLAFASISSGPLALHTCSLTAGGTAYCWGYNYSGQLGDNTTTNRPAPTQVVGAGTAPLVFTALSAGGVHTCGVTADNALYCWGNNAFGELGDGTLTDRYTPAQVTGSGSAPLRFTAVTARRLHSCGLTTDGAVYCWGSNALGELGDGLEAVGWTDDGLVEAIEHRDGWLVGVQWHPEESAARDRDQAALFEALVARAGR